MTSLLHDIDLNKAMKDFDDTRRTTASDRYEKEAVRAHAGLRQLAIKAAAQHDDPVDANNAAADLLERFSDSVEQNGDGIVHSLAQQSAGNSFSSQAHRLELQDAQDRVERYRATADRASDLEVKLSEANDENSRLQQELDGVKRNSADNERRLAEVIRERDQLKQNGDRPNPLQARVQQLESENASLTSENNNLRERLERADELVQQLQQQLEQPDAQSEDEGSEQEPESQHDDDKSHRGIGGLLFGGVNKPARKSRRARNN